MDPALNPRRRWWPVALAALLLWALALRAWMAVPELHAGRFWDERYALENVEALLAEGRWLPVNAYHPSLAHLPQAAVLAVPHAIARSTGDADFAVLRPGGFTPLAYLVARLVQALFGALSIYWLFRVGRRLFDVPTALLAAALMAVVPWHLRQSVIFKPDILLVLVQLVAFEWALAAFDRPRPGRFLRAGAGVGLAMGAKYNGVAAALPLVAGWLSGPARRRMVAGLALAATAAIATFLLLNPHLALQPEMLARDFGTTLRDYANKGAEAAAGRGDIVLHAVSSLTGEAFHGRIVGPLALAGLLWLTVTAIQATPERRRQLSMLVTFPVGYVVFYAAATNNPSDHNWLPIVPFTALAAAAPAVAIGRAAGRRASILRRRPLLPAAAVVAVLFLAGGSTAYAYRVAVSSTWEEVDRLVLSHLGDDSGHRLVWQEGLDRFRVGRRTHRGRKPVLVSPEEARAAGFGPSATDARVHLLADREAARPAAEARESAGTGTFRVRPNPFRHHGPALRVVLHPWQRSGEPVRLSAEAGIFSVPPLAPDPGQAVWVTVEVFLPGGPLPAGLGLEWNGHRLPLFWGGTRGAGRSRFVTPRVAAPAGPTTLRVLGEPSPAVAWTELHRWSPPAADTGVAAAP